MPGNGEIVEDVVEQFQKVQMHMKNAKEEKEGKNAGDKFSADNRSYR